MLWLTNLFYLISRKSTSIIFRDGGSISLALCPLIHFSTRNVVGFGMKCSYTQYVHGGCEGVYKLRQWKWNYVLCCDIIAFLFPFIVFRTGPSDCSGLGWTNEMLVNIQKDRKPIQPGCLVVMCLNKKNFRLLISLSSFVLLYAVVTPMSNGPRGLIGSTLLLCCLMPRTSNWNLNLKGNFTSLQLLVQQKLLMKLTWIYLTRLM